jgi:hypothetical protein
MNSSIRFTGNPNTVKLRAGASNQLPGGIGRNAVQYVQRQGLTAFHGGDDGWLDPQPVVEVWGSAIHQHHRHGCQ